MSIDLLAWRSQANNDRASIEAVLGNACDANDPTLSQLARQAVAPHTSRLRASMAIIGGSAAKLNGELNADLANAAAAVELVHLGAVTHDDVIDDVRERGHSPTVNAEAGNLQAILAGDFLMARASEYAAAHGTRVAQILAETIGWICEGRARQLALSGDARPTAEQRLDTLNVRHASLYDTAATIGGLVAGVTDEVATRLGRLGRHVGMALTIHSDVERLVSGDRAIGSPPHADLERRVWTLPVAIAGPAAMDKIDAGADIGEVHSMLLGEPTSQAVSHAREELASARSLAAEIGIDATEAFTSIDESLTELS